MRTLLLPFAAAALAGSLLFAACGDGPDKDDTPTATASADASDDGWPPDPQMTKNIKDISPKNGESIAQAATRPRGTQPRGLCIDVSLEGLPPNDARWFQLAIDGVRVTEHITWFAFDGNTSAIGCYVPDEGLPVGRHQVAAAVQNPDNLNAAPEQLVGWEFEVTP
ncbi:MAG: hypothetical protein ACM3S1_05745 [Hyphomicrobiales bacterium]